MAYTETSLFQRTLAQRRGRDKDAAPRKRLRDALSGLRDRAAVLAGEIDRDLPGLTVHDITHLDALWEMADLIAGTNYPLNPLEAFTLGGAFLLHDLGLGLAAWPGGKAELEKGPGWQDALSAHLRKQLGRTPTPEELTSPPPEIEKVAIEERLRLLHAERAADLAFATWSDPKGGADYHLIDDPDLRQALGPLLGRIAHSHWWPVSRLSSEFGTVVGALPYCPTSWTIDPLKVAVLLRTADAAHLDARRAPGFLRALRRPEGMSREHWIFQEHLLKPRLEAERLVYTTARPFAVDEVDAWWLCEETLRMVDREFHQVDSLLADLGRWRLQARGIAGVDSPSRLRNYVEVTGWCPVDARIHVSNIADLARKLGGEQLYGNDPLIPLRELIQNAADAIRARRLLEDLPVDWGRVTVRLGKDKQGWWIEVEDTGIGMSEAVLTGPLLDFGTTYWGSILMREEHEGLWSKGFEPTGRFGIGFFSVFMWGQRANVTTRPYSEAKRDTRVLEFRTGLDARPIIRPAIPNEQLQSGGTRVRVWLKVRPDHDGGLLFSPSRYSEKRRAIGLGELCAWLAPALDVDLYAEEAGHDPCRVVAASDWLVLEASHLLARVTLDCKARSEVGRIGPLVRRVDDSEGRALGRGAIHQAKTLASDMGVITVGGLRANNVRGLFGILAGTPARATRDKGVLLASDHELATWASEQARLLAASIRDPSMQLSYASLVVAFGGHPGDLPIAQRNKDFVTLEELLGWSDAPDEIFLVTGLSGLSEHRGSALYPHVLVTSKMYPPIPLRSYRLLDELVKDALAQIWGCSPQELLISDEERVVGLLQGQALHAPTYVIRKPGSRSGGSGAR